MDSKELTLYRLPEPGGEDHILAWGCACGKTPGEKMAVIEWNDEAQHHCGVKYSFCHIDCLEKVEDE